MVKEKYSKGVNGVAYMTKLCEHFYPIRSKTKKFEN